MGFADPEKRDHKTPLPEIAPNGVPTFAGCYWDMHGNIRRPDGSILYAHGRPPEITDEQKAKIFEARRLGKSGIDCARYAEVNPVVLRQYLMKGKKYLKHLSTGKNVSAAEAARKSYEYYIQFKLTYDSCKVGLRVKLSKILVNIASGESENDKANGRLLLDILRRIDDDWSDKPISTTNVAASTASATQSIVTLLPKLELPQDAVPCPAAENPPTSKSEDTTSPPNTSPT